MAASYQQLLHDVGLRMNALVGTQVATLAASYNTAVLTAAQFKSADFPFNSFRDAILMAEGQFAWAISETGNSPLRGNISIPTGSMAHASQIPSTIGTVKRIGVLGNIRDADDNTPCTEKPLDVILRRVRNANGHYVTPVYHYKIDSDRIFHTRTNVTADACIWSRTAQATIFDANGNMLLPDILELPIVALAIALLVKNTSYAANDQAVLYGKYAMEALAAIRAGSTNVLPKSVPLPVTEGKAA
jgi:hypothetical protein